MNVRDVLLGESVRFVREAQQTPGVLRIALLGSITSAKVAPKDIDFLVTVAEDCDLVVLALHSRRLKGRLQGYNRTADVFLADPHGRYLGRVCSWRECRPGKRASCDALHCGQRPHLHDDIGAVRLAPELVAAPPLVVWPAVVRHAPLPADVEAWVSTVSHAV